MGYFVPLLLAVGAAILLAYVAGGALIGLESSSATQVGRPHGRFDMPPFEMTRVVTGPDGREAVFHFRWENEEKWKETLVSTNSPVPAWAQHDPAGFLNLGSYQEAVGGKLIQFDMARECLTCPLGRRHESQADADLTLIPGVWFVDLDALIRTRRQAQVIETETEVTVRATTLFDTEEWVFDRKTGIPIGYRTMPPGGDGSVSTESRATSVVLLSGETIR
jgi:hypothetical protein